MLHQVLRCWGTIHYGEVSSYSVVFPAESMFGFLVVHCGHHLSVAYEVHRKAQPRSPVDQPVPSLVHCPGTRPPRSPVQLARKGNFLFAVSLLSKNLQKQFLQSKIQLLLLGGKKKQPEVFNHVFPRAHAPICPKLFESCSSPSCQCSVPCNIVRSSSAP